MPPRALGVGAGTALYVGAVLGPGVLLLPGLAVSEAGPASVIAWCVLLAVSVPLVVTFVALGVAHPAAGGAAEYARQAFGPVAGAVTGWWFLSCVAVGAPAVALIGGLYVGELTATGHAGAIVSGSCMFALVLAVNVLGIRASSRLQMAMVALLVVLMLTAVAAALPSAQAERWSPFAPHGWVAVGGAASLLSMSFVGWEAVTFLVGGFGDPRRDLPRAAFLAWLVVSVLYLGLAVATVGALAGEPASQVPLADLVERGLGGTGRDVTAAVAALLTMGTMNAYVAGAAQLARSMAEEGVAPAWLEGGSAAVPLRPLVPLAAIGAASMCALAARAIDAEDVIRVISACFMAVYLVSTAAGARLLTGRARAASQASLALVAGVSVFFGAFLLYPAGIAALAALYVRGRRRAALVASPAGRPR